MPSGRTVVTCPAPFGGGGLGRHLQELVDAVGRRSGQRAAHISEDAGLQIARTNARQLSAHIGARATAPLGRGSPAWRIFSASVAFDARAAERLPSAENLIAFNGTALAQLRAAPGLGYRSRSLVAANSHYRNVLRRHALAHRQYPVEAPWPTHLLRRNLHEYALAQRVLVASRYIWESFVAEGFPEERLSRFPLTPDPRFEPRPAGLPADTFDVVYVGSLTVHKGIPLLVEAFRSLAHEDMRLVLVGGWKSPGMRRFIQRTCAEDPRVQVRPGDPLERLRAAALCVHPAYEDGFAYAPAEALACGVPLLVSEDTGMKELIGAGARALVLPTGDLAALTDAIEAAYRREILSP